MGQQNKILMAEQEGNQTQEKGTYQLRYSSFILQPFTCTEENGQMWRQDVNIQKSDHDQKDFSPVFGTTSNIKG